jgi:hypothetical protein
MRADFTLFCYFWLEIDKGQKDDVNMYTRDCRKRIKHVRRQILYFRPKTLVLLLKEEKKMRLTVHGNQEFASY